MYRARGPWLCASLVAAAGCLWSAVLGGPGGDGTPDAEGRPRPKHVCDTDTSLFQIFTHAESDAESELRQWSTDDVWAADAADELARPSPAGAPGGPPTPGLSLAKMVPRSAASSTAMGIAAAFVGVVLVLILCVFANKVEQSSANHKPEQPRDKKGQGVAKTTTMQSSVSIRSERSMHSTTSSYHHRAGKMLSAKLLSQRRASESYQPRARTLTTSNGPRMVAQDTTFAAGWAQASSLVVQHVSSQHMAGVVPNSSGNISVGGMSATTEGSAFAVGGAAASQGQGRAGYVPGDCRFLVPVDILVEAAEQGDFTIEDAASGLLLRVGIDNKAGARFLRVFVGRDSPNPCTIVRAVPDGGSMDEGMEIRGANGLHFGTLALQPNGSFLVTTAEQQPLLTIEGNEANLDLRISARDGRLVASVSCCESPDPSRGVEHVEFRVLPGTDPVLVVSCILSVLLLGGDDEDD